MRGRVRMYRDGIRLFEVNNLVVVGATGAAAALAAGASSAYSVSRAGFGSGTQTPSFNDASLSGTVQYFNNITATSFPATGSVTFNFSITAADYAATPGINIQEIGLFGITNGVGIPASINVVTSLWQANASYAVGALIKDSNNNVQRCTQAGTSNPNQHPTWNTAINGVTTDNSVSWQMVAGSTAPVPMWAHALVPSFTFNGSANYTGSWTLTF